LSAGFHESMHRMFEKNGFSLVHHQTSATAAKFTAKGIIIFIAISIIQVLDIVFFVKDKIKL
jgi:hypothetical protein